MGALTGKTVGVWTSSGLWTAAGGEAADAAAELDDLGYEALWLGSSGGDLQLHESLLAATTGLVVASGIINGTVGAAGARAESHTRDGPGDRPEHRP